MQAAEQQKKNFDAQYKKLVEEFKKACQKLVSDFAPVRTEVNDVAARATEFERKFDKLSKDFDEERESFVLSPPNVTYRTLQC